MSALGQQQTLEKVRLMSALPPKPDMDHYGRDVRFVPKADIMQCSNQIAPIGRCTVEFSPVVGADCKAPAHSHHILPLALSVLPHPVRGR